MNVSARQTVASWIAPGIVLMSFAGLAFTQTASDPNCNGGCAQGTMFGAVFVLPAAYVFCVLGCKTLTAKLAQGRKFTFFRFVLAAALLGSVPLLPLLAVSVWLQFLVDMSVFLVLTASAITGSVAVVWWLIAFGPSANT